MYKIEEVSFQELCHLTEKQKEAFQALKQYKYLLYGGASWGGKSYFLRWGLAYLLLYWFETLNIRNIRVGMFCEDYPTLKDRQIDKIETEFPLWFGSYNKGDHEFTLAPQYGSGKIAFRNLDNPSKYKSTDFAAVAIDELTRNKEDVFDILGKMRLKWLGIDEPRFLAATNPDGIGRGWVKKRWLDKIFTAEEQIEAKHYYYIPATVYDNPHNSVSCIDQLKALPENLRKAYLDGNWDTFEGQFFTEFDRSIHVVKPFDINPILQSHGGYIGLDYGFNPAFSGATWTAKLGKQRIRYRELYEKKLTPIALADKIMEYTASQEVPYLQAIYYDPSMNSIHAGENPISKQMQDRFDEKHFWVKMIPAANDRHTRAYSMRENLRVYEDYVGRKTSDCLIFDTCPRYIETLAGLVHDKRDPEDVDTNGDDHLYDADTYGLITDAGVKILDIKSVLSGIRLGKQLVTAGNNW